MLVVDLHCAHGHHFEGWFASKDELASQKARGLLTCPVCGDNEVVRRPSAPHLSTSGLKEAQPAKPQGHQPPGAPPSSRQRPPASVPSAGSGELAPLPSQQVQAVPPDQAKEMMEVLQSLYLKAVRHVVEHTEDVGERFAQEARSIHHGDAPERAIRGQASPDEKEALREEGIDFLTLAIPEGFKGPLQ